jgi:GNAT superfamily N-acetyltransferase
VTAVRPAGPTDRDWIAGTLAASWGAKEVISRGRIHDAAALPALVAVGADGERIGLLTYRIDEDGLEVVTLEAVRRYEGIGTALLAAARDVATEAARPRLWLVTSNDNLAAVRFYQRRGLRIVAVHVGAADEARRLKPTIPLVGSDGIEIHDEIELAVSVQ